MEKEMLVSKIKQGIVIDHIEAGKGIEIFNLLKGHVEGRAVLLHMAESRKMGRKDILKIEGGLSSERDLKLVALFSPNATINWIKNWEVVRKEKVKAPEEVGELLRCPNPKCITNDEREMRFVKTFFVRKKGGYYCRYCNARIGFEEVPEYINLNALALD